MRSVRIIAFFSLVLLASGAELLAQTVTVPATGSISGQVKIGDAPARSMAVVLTLANRLANTSTTTRVNTDADGRYKFSEIAAGTFRVSVLAPGYIVFGTSELVRSGQQVTLKDGEAVERIDFTLTRGGVITGRITGNSNRPMVGEPISLSMLDETGKLTALNPPAGVNFRTDDQGNYRAYGLPPGQYFVSAGRSDNRGGGGPFRPSARTYQLTYHPDVIDQQQATAVSIEAGKEVNDVDIRLSMLETYAVVGRVVEADTGNPVISVLIGHTQVSDNNRRGPMPMMGGGGTDGMTDDEGRFRIEGLTRGRYTVYVVQDQQHLMTSEYYSEPVSFEISTTDATGLEIKMQRGASISGLAVLDGATDPGILASLRLNAAVRGSQAGRTNSTATIAPNGLFRVSGLAPGRVNLNVMDTRNAGPFGGPTVMRIERDGVEVNSGLEVAPGEQVAGVKIFLVYGTSIIRGVVRVEGGTLTPDMRVMAMARRTDGAGNSGGGRGGGGGGVMPAQVDASGQFQIQGLVAGTYEVTVQAMGGFGGGGFGGGRGGQGGQPGQPQQQVRIAPATQTVVVGSNATQNVMLTLNLAATAPAGTTGAPGGQGRNQGGTSQPGQRRRP